MMVLLPLVLATTRSRVSHLGSLSTSMNLGVACFQDRFLSLLTGCLVASFRAFRP